jgi:putative transcriptional regulator
MRIEDPEHHDLLGRFLLADPMLQDPNFSRTVILVTEQDPQGGALGYILNRPSSDCIGDLVPVPDFEGLSDVPVFYGGPVATNRLTLLSLAWDEDAGTLNFSCDLSPAEAQARREEGFTIRAFLGYAGWGRGQLEGELIQRAWIVSTPHPLAAKKTPDQSLWADILKHKRPYFRLIAEMPIDPSMN